MASAIAEMGLLTALLSRVWRISPMPPGALEAASWASARVEGNRKLATTAHSAARRVPMR